MKYHAPTQQFTIEPRALRGVVLNLRYAIKHIRTEAGLPLAAHEHDWPMAGPQFAEKALLDAAAEIGIDMGADWPGKLDVSDAS